jgi:hypothetical protein
LHAHGRFVATGLYGLKVNSRVDHSGFGTRTRYGCGLARIDPRPTLPAVGLAQPTVPVARHRYNSKGPLYGIYGRRTIVAQGTESRSFHFGVR